SLGVFTLRGGFNPISIPRDSSRLKSEEKGNLATCCGISEEET
ncbi:hypothetical protein L195_g061929, partial [Trifolium pratense]